jgi:hypothetical protein
MDNLPVEHRNDRRFPRWVIFGALGILISWVVALGDWAMVDVGVFHRQFHWMPTFTLGGVNEVAVDIYKKNTRRPYLNAKPNT